MKKIAILLLGAFFFVTAHAQNLESYFHYSAFNSPEGSFVETYLSTIGNSAVFNEI